jgi:hypothetical protein
VLLLTRPPTAQALRASGSQLIPRLSNGPRTFEEACNHFGFTHQEAQKLAFGCSLVSSPSRTLLQVHRPISQAHRVAPSSYSQQINGKGEFSGIPPNNVAPPASFQSCGPPSTSTASSRLSTRPDPNHVSHWIEIANQATTSAPDLIGPLNHAGESPLIAFVDRWDGTFCCLVPVEGEFCGYRNGKKERMLSHIRDKHLDQRPWRCGGQCGTDAW